MSADAANHAGQAGTIRVLVVDDEPFNRVRLESLLEHEPAVEVVGTAGDGAEAIEAIRTLRPDLVFLDVQMPEKSGIDVVREIGPTKMPATIFVTAYSRYAVEAFDLAAVDYLVKPFDDERFEEALQRARRALAVEGLDRLREQLVALMRASETSATSGAVAPPRASPYLERIAVDIRGTVRAVPVSDINYITSDGPYAELHVGDRRYIIREALQTLEERLDPARFMRVHRSVIVRLDLVEALKRGAGGDGEVLLKGGVRLRVSRTRREALERWLGLSS
jgi:two-component system, LytTR family, response regulator